MNIISDGRRYPWTRAAESMALDIAERATSDEEFRQLWDHLGIVVRYLVTHDPRCEPVTDGLPPAHMVEEPTP